MHKVKIRHLETLIAFMKTGSVTEAAKLLNTTQPNATKSLQQLEEFVGVAMFQRTGGNLYPTPEAELLLSLATRLVEDMSAFENISSDIKQLKGGTVRIAVLATFSTAVVPITVERFSRQYPNIQVQVDILDSDKIHSAVSRGNYDFGLIHHPEHEPDLLANTLHTGSMVFIMQPQHRLAANNTIIASDLINENFISYPRAIPFGAFLHKALMDEGIRVAISLFSNQSQLVRRLVERGCGVALIDEFAVWDANSDERLILRRFEPRIPISIGIIVPKRRPLSLAAQAFRSHLEQTLTTPPSV